jgi:hypothetical protein
LPVANTLAYLAASSTVTKKKSFITLAPGVDRQDGLLLLGALLELVIRVIVKLEPGEDTFFGATTLNATRYTITG